MNKNRKQYSFDLWLPVELYTLTPIHCVLAELGEISHFILKGMGKSSLTLQDIETITGLNSEQLNPICERLVKLGYLFSNLQLTQSGKAASCYLDHIHNHPVEIYIDKNLSRRNQPLLLLQGAEKSVNNIPENAIKLMDKKYVGNSEEIFLQTQRLRRYLPTVLPSLFPKMKTILENVPKNWDREWELTLEKVHGPQKGISATVPFKNYSPEAPGSETFRVMTEVLSLYTNFEPPKGINWQKYIAPKPLEASYSFSEDQIYTGDISSEKNEGDHQFHLSGDNISLEKHARELMNHVTEELKENSKASSRIYEFRLGWQSHCYSFEEILGYFKYADIIKAEICEQ